MTVISAVEKFGAVYRIYADGRLLASLSAAAFERAPLREGDAIDPDAYLAKIAVAQMNEAYEAALNALDRAAKSEKALRRYLALRGFVEPAIDAAVARLHGARLIDDGAIAGRMVEAGAAGGLSRSAIKRKLRLKGVSEEDAEGALEAVSDEDQLDSAKRLAGRLYPKYAPLERRAARARLSQALARRGFSWDVIDQAISGLFER